MKRIDLKLDEELFELLTAISNLKKVNTTDIITSLIQDYVKKYKGDVEDSFNDFWYKKELLK